ncbi:MAG: VTC domain-containing protein [Pirellulaceae bacterium]|nr:VTC domain-containing protein [Pirellulaceae bacterium]
MKFTPRSELVFALDLQTTDALIALATRDLSKPTIQHVADRYYESSDSKASFARQREYRVRRIHHADDVILQSLNWEQDKYSLRQTLVPAIDLANLRSDVIDKSWAGKWFHKKIVKHSLVPTLETRFDRTTFQCATIDGEYRLTVDRNLHAQHVSQVSVTANIVRMNFATSLPTVFKTLIYQFALLPERPTVLLELVKSARTTGKRLFDGDSRQNFRRITFPLECLDDPRSLEACDAPDSESRSNQQVITCQLG